MEICSREEDKEWAGIVLWLLVTDKEAHVSSDGSIRIRDCRHANKRRKRREGQAAIEAAELKRLRKANKGKRS